MPGLLAETLKPNIFPAYNMAKILRLLFHRRTRSSMSRWRLLETLLTRSSLLVDAASGMVLKSCRLSRV